MADQYLDYLRSTLRSSKLVFWQENQGLPENEIQKLWNIRVADLTTDLGANIPGVGQSVIPQKRAIQSALSIDGSRPSKRRDVVGFSVLASYTLV
jgi:hypothetical protein